MNELSHAEQLRLACLDRAIAFHAREPDNGLPPGTILPYAAEGCPPGFLPCDGRAVPQVAFQRLHEAIGDAYGAVPPRRFRWRRFRVPDLRASARPAAALAYEKKYSQGTWQPPSWGYVIRT